MAEAIGYESDAAFGLAPKRNREAAPRHGRTKRKDRRYLRMTGSFALKAAGSLSHADAPSRSTKPIVLGDIRN